jgi:hypothetical protein
MNFTQIPKVKAPFGGNMCKINDSINMDLKKLNRD